MCDKQSNGSFISIPNDFLTENPELQKRLEALTSTSSIVEQQKLLKELTREVETTDDVKLIVKVFCQVFLTIDPKHPLKKTVTRILLNLYEEVVVPILDERIIALIKDCEVITDKLSKQTKENSVLVSLNTCLSNFPPGIKALSSIIDLVFIFACSNFAASISYLYRENEIEKHILHTCIYNASKFLVAILNQCDISQLLPEYSFRLVVSCFKIITDEHIPFNTKANCGILLVMAALHTPECDKDKNNKYDLANLLKLETEEKGEAQANTSLFEKNYSAKICIFSGILNVIPHEVICADKLDEVPAPIYMFQSLLDSAARHTGKPYEIMEISRTFISLSKILFNMEVCDIEVIFKPGLDYIWTHLDHFIDTVRHDTIIVLKNFVKIAVLQETNGHKVLMDEILSYISSLLEGNNTNYKALTVISNEATCQYLLKKFPDLPNKLLANIKNSSLAQQICSTYESMMEQNAKENDSWVEVWIKNLTPLIHESDSTTCVYYQKIFTAAFKISQSVIKFLSYEHRIFDNPNVLGALLSCFICARNMNSTVTFYSDDVSDNLWNGMLDYDLLDFLMCHQTPEIRISILTLIIESQKTTQIFPEWDLMFLIRFLHYNCTSQMPHIRQQIVALFKKAFTRYKESLHVIERNIKSLNNKLCAIGNTNPKVEEELNACKLQESYYKKFVTNLFEDELVKGLFENVNHYRRSMCLELLTFIKTCISPEQFARLWKEEFVILLYEALNDTYESNIILASRLLLDLPKPISYYHSKDILKTEITNAVTLAASIRPTCTTSAAYYLQVYKNSPHAVEVLCDIQKIAPPKKGANVTLILVNYLINEIEKGLEIAKDSVLKASKYAPIYGLIFCLRHLIQKEHFEEIYPAAVPKILDLCNRVSLIASPIVNTSSPEGFMPTDSEHVVDETVTSQMILVYAWRTVKEISLLLGELLLVSSKGEQIVAPKYVEQIIDYFITLFMETKHRGAYEQAYLGFSKFCAKLWNATGNFSEKPIDWLNTILEVLQGKKDHFTKLCATRRSAGVPFIIQAILTTELQKRNHESFHHCMKTLLEIANDLSEKNEKAAIHSMNILRALYKHNQLGELVVAYVAKGVMIAIIGFSHPVWGVRNSATLMFSALMTRIFGVQRTKDSEEISIKNRLSSRVFFMRYPELYSFILGKLKEYVAEENSVSLYPLLFILARLFPSADKSEMLIYLPCINKCLESSICKMRELAAQASISAIPTDDYADYIVAIFGVLKEDMSQNLLHGKLLQLQLLLKNLPSNHKEIDIPKLVEGTFWIVEKVGIRASHMASKLYMEIMVQIIIRFKDKCHGKEEFVSLMKLLVENMDKKQLPAITAKSNFELTRLALYMHLLSNALDIPIICREKFLKDIILRGLQSDNEDLQIFSLNCIKYLFDSQYYTHYVSCDYDDEEKSELEDGIVKQMNSDMKLLLISAISTNFNSQNLFTDLFHILKTRKKAYSIKVCGILAYFPCLIPRIRPKNIPVILSKQMILDFLICECKRGDSDLFCAIVPLMATLISEAKQNINFSRIIHQILKPYSTPNNTEEERMVVANFLVQNSKLLHDRDIVPLKDQVEIWYIVLTLLQDNDEAVRNQISKITNCIQDPFSSSLRRSVLGLYVISEKSLEELIQFMPEYLPLDEAMRIYLTLALKPKKQIKHDNSDPTEVFEKGELNTYEEGDPIAILATICLKHQLWALEDNLNYEDNSIFVEEHTLLVATKLFNLVYGGNMTYMRSEDKLLGMLVLKEVMYNLEFRTIRKGDFKKDFTNLLEKKFKVIPNMFNYSQLETFFKYILSYDD